MYIIPVCWMHKSSCPAQMTVKLKVKMMQLKTKRIEDESKKEFYGDSINRLNEENRLKMK